MARRHASWAVGLVAVLALLEVLGGRAATVALTGSIGATAPLGLAYVLVWLLVVAVAPALLLAAGIESLLGALGRRNHAG